MSLDKSLTNGAIGGSLLFCGAGFSAGCLNFKDEELGAAWPLLKALNNALGYEFEDLQVAADEYAEEKGENQLFTLLQDRYSVTKRTSEIDEILRYPWTRIYTTNYDDVISQSLTSSGKSHYVANNLETPFEVSQHSKDKTWVVHLHGAQRKWEFNSFKKSCVLGRESYLRISADFKWATTLQEDYARATAVFFVGFSNSDFYLAQHLFSAEASKDKVFFINGENSAGNRELVAKQRKYGTPLAIGREGFAQKISEALKIGGFPELELHSFEKELLPEASYARASVLQQEAFMISGTRNGALHYRDFLDASQSYRAVRSEVEEISDFLSREDENAVALVVGGICSGKTTVIEEVILSLLTKGEIVYRLNAKFHDFLDEARKIIETSPNAILVIDNCFSLKRELDEIIERANGAGTRLLLGSRTLAYDSEPDLRTRLIEGTKFKLFDTDILDETERDSLIHCADRIGVWGSNVTSQSQKVRLVEKSHSSRLSSFLLGVFNSSQVRDRFRSELDLMLSGGESIRRTLIIALYLKSIGEPVNEHVLSSLAQTDSVSLFKKASNSGAFLRFIPERQSFELLPSINAREALRKLFDPKKVTDSVVSAVQAMEDLRFQPAFKRVFSEFMRYTQLKQVVSEFEQQDSFFDRLSELSFCHRHVLFWLQWSMAMRDHREFPRAKQYLDEAYGRAKGIPNYDTSHLDDQKAGLLLDSIGKSDSSANYLRCFNDAVQLLARGVQTGEVTSHNYLTMRSFENFFDGALPNLSEIHRGVMEKGLGGLERLVQKKYDEQFDGFVKNAIHDALATIRDSKERLRAP